ncbi:MAG TPA: glycosyltransferase family 39 protein [Solirubrobacteraceae bacterium]|jgi:4-amino-4-deoxy-L-arabinose transferase-like glycosyltransferase
MSSSEGALAAAPTQHTRHARPRTLALGRIWPEPLALALLAGLLNFWDLARNGWANTYYTGAIRSMSSSWHNFLFASFDPSGVMTVDKPPLALWIETASVKLFGFHSVAILAPQGLMGIASVLLVYDLTRRRFGRPAGFLAGLVLALTPITVAISRHNNPDALLVLCCVAALWCAVRALEDRRTRWFVLAGVCVGLGFETKMLIALVVLPGIAAAWAWCRPARASAGGRGLEESPVVDASLQRPRRAHARARVRARRGPFTNAFTAAVAMLVVGGAWPLLVELTPAGQRPWISGTADNRILSLIFGYNGLGRIEGQSGGPQALGGSNVFGGSTGPLRLLNEALGGQAGWLLGFTLLSGLAILLACRLRRNDPRSAWLLVVGGAFLTTAVIFSFAHGIFHPYYVSLLAPFSAALVGAGFAQLQHSGLQMRILAALALAAGVATELAVLHDYPGELRWLIPTLIFAGALAAALLLLGTPRLRFAALAAALALLLVAPATWAVQTLGHATSSTFPAGGPANNPAGGFGGPGPGGGPGGRGFPGARAGGFAGRPPAAAQGAAGASGESSSGPAQGVPAGAPALFGSGEGEASSGARASEAATGGVPAAAGAAPTGRLGASTARAFAPGAGGSSAAGPGGASSQSLLQSVRYAKAHGGGTIAVASQSEAAPLVIDGDSVAGIGGFSGRESETNAAWLAQEVRAGHVRWVLTTSGGPGGFGGAGLGGASSLSSAPSLGAGGAQGPPSGGGHAGGIPGQPAGAGSGTRAGGHEERVGATHALAAVEKACKRVGAVSGLYDCRGRAAQLAAA